MRIACASDEPYAVHDVVIALLERRGHEVVRFGALASGKDEPWVQVAEQAARSVADGGCERGVFACWTGTGITMAANKVPGIRAALCADAGTARGARIWNHANVLCLSNRLLSPDLAKEILDAFLDADAGHDGDDGVAALAALDDRYRR